MVEEIKTDAWGRKIKIDSSKVGSSKKSICLDCKKHWKTCENEDIKRIENGKVVTFGPPTDKKGNPILLYCGYFKPIYPNEKIEGCGELYLPY